MKCIAGSIHQRSPRCSAEPAGRFSERRRCSTTALVAQCRPSVCALLFVQTLLSKRPASFIQSSISFLQAFVRSVHSFSLRGYAKGRALRRSDISRAGA